VETQSPDCRRLASDWPTVERLTCFDVAYDAAWLQEKAASEPGLSFTATRPEGKYDLVLMLDVLEHAEDDKATLADITMNFLQPRGHILLSVPAYSALYSSHDDKLGHKRRYAPARLRAMVRDAGLEIVDHGELFASLLLPRTFAKLSEVVLGKVPSGAPTTGARIETALGTWHHGQIMTSLVSTALSLDAACSRLASRLRLPFAGLSTWILAQCP